MGLFQKSSKPTKVEVSEKNVRLRFILVVLLVALGIGLIVSGFYSLITKEPGWYTIELTDGATHLNDELIFNCYLEGDKLSVSDKYKAVEKLYTAEANKIYRLLDVYEEHDDIVNLYTINQNPGKTFEVDKSLYDAFALIEETESRILYMAPVFSSYRQLFSSLNDAEAALYDPYSNEETKQYLAEVLEYACDPSMIQVQLLGDNRVCLYVSDEYLAFLKENGIDSFIDFGWLTNAFVVDYIAQVMIERGFTSGAITSYDGYTRNFDSSNSAYAFNVFDRSENNVYPAATARYNGYISMVFMRDYPMSTRDMTEFYAYEDGHYVHRYIDTATGAYKSALHNLVSYAYDRGCAEVAIRMADVFISDDLDLDKLTELEERQIYSVWCLEGAVYYNDKNTTIADLYEDDKISYKSEFFSSAE